MQLTQLTRKENSKLPDHSLVTNEFIAYSKLYNLPTITHAELIDDVFFKYVKKRKFFLTIVAFDEGNRILVLRDFSKNYGWELLGGSIEQGPKNNIHKTAQRIAKQLLDISLYDIQPIAFIDNIFKNHNTTVKHEGLALAARINGNIKASQDIEWGLFKELPTHMFLANKEIAKLAMEIVKDKQYKPALDEVTSSHEASWRYSFHKLFIHPLIGRPTSKKLRKALINQINELNGPLKSFLDTSCGDDNFLLKVALEYPAASIVGNDISMRHLNFLQAKQEVSRLDKSIIFTNHDLLDIPFANIFDIVLSKNTLHHLDGDSSVVNVLAKFKKIGKNILIMDIEDPTKSSLIAWLWNKYYVHFLKDQGDHFLTYEKLDSILASLFTPAEYRIKRVRTLKGTYLMAWITPKSSI